MIEYCMIIWNEDGWGPDWENLLIGFKSLCDWFVKWSSSVWTPLRLWYFNTIHIFLYTWKNPINLWPHVSKSSDLKRPLRIFFDQKLSHNIKAASTSRNVQCFLESPRHDYHYIFPHTLITIITPTLSIFSVSVWQGDMCPSPTSHQGSCFVANILIFITR